MVRLIFILYCFCAGFLHAKEREHNVCVCAIFHNESRFLKEWVDHYIEEGVDKIYLYNNNSDDDYLKVLSKYIKVNIVCLRDWPYTFKDISEWNDIQCRSYMDCIRNVKGVYKWCIFVDTDEFLFSPTGKSIKETLKSYEEYDQIGACWVFYGTSNIQRLPDGERLKDNMVYRSKDVNNHVKSIVRPEKVVTCVNPHFFIVYDPSKTVNENQECMSGAFTNPSAGILRINHYWTRDRNFFYNEKLRRQKVWSSRDIESLIEAEFSMNEVYDPILSQYK